MRRPDRGVRRYATKPGTVAKLCPCGTMMNPGQLACFDCFRNLPADLRARYDKARRVGGDTLDRASEAILAYIREHRS